MGNHVLLSRVSMVSVLNGDASIDIKIHNGRNEDDHFHIPSDEDEDEKSRNDLSAFSSLSSIGLSLKIGEDSNGINGNGINSNLNGASTALEIIDDLGGFSSTLGRELRKCYYNFKEKYQSTISKMELS
jgi:hypothetical protein